jgi:putative tryptophan/tyrosine transport system substrate-binding protein
VPDLAADLVRLKVDIIVAEGTGTTSAAKKATTTIPIVMAESTDPVGTGLVASLARPGGNITGLTAAGGELAGKHLELLKEIVPRLSRVGCKVMECWL